MPGVGAFSGPCAVQASAMSVCDWAGVGVHVRMRSTADDLCEENQ